MSVRRETLDDLLPPPDQTFQLLYEPYNAGEPFCLVRVWQVEGRSLILATDECDAHQSTSVTNRIERIMYLAWNVLKCPVPVWFAEHYRPEPGAPETVDEVCFDWGTRAPLLASCYANGKLVGKQFVNPVWRRVGNPELLKSGRAFLQGHLRSLPTSSAHGEGIHDGSL